MNRRFKLFFSLVSLCFSIAMLCFGVYSAMSVNYSVSGTVSYELDRAYVNISTKLYLSKEGLINQSKLNTKINEIYEEISTNGTDNSDFDSLSVVESTQYQDEPYLSVDDNGAINQDTSPTSGEMNINYGSFSQTSTDESAYSYYIVVEVENIGSNNAYVKLDSSSLQAENSIVKSNTELLSLDGKVDETDVDYFVIGMALDDPTTSIGENTFNFIIEVSDEQPDPEPISDAIYTLNSEAHEATYVEYLGSEEEVIIPETIGVAQSAIKEETYSEDDIVSMMSSDMGMVKAFRYVKITESNNTVSTFQTSSEQEQEPVLFYEWIMSKLQIDESSREPSFPSVSFPITVEYCDTIINSLPEEVTDEETAMFTLYPLMMPIEMLASGYIDSFTLEIGEGETYATAVIDYAYIEGLFTSTEPDTTDPINNYFYTIMSSSSGMPDISSLEQFLPIKYTNIMTTNIYPGGTIGEQYKVTAIKERAFRDCTTLTSVIISDSVISIGENAFSGCDQLVTIEFGDNSQLQSIGSYAFDSCSITSITIPDSVTSIGSAFSNCDALTTITFEDNSQLQSIENSTFSSLNKLTTVYFGDNSQLQSIGSYAFYNCSSLTTIDFGDNSQLQSIGSSAFHYCSSLTSITIPDRVSSIGSYSFNGCDNLAMVKFGDNSQLQSIGSYAFDDCTNLVTVDFGDNSNLQSIEKEAFSGCYNLKNIYIGSVYDWLKISFEYSYTAYEISNPLINGAQLYVDGKPLTEITADDFTNGEDTIQNISDYAFHTLDSLTSITIPDSVTSIGSSAFSNCDNLITVTFKDNSQLQSIGERAFSGCSGLTTVNFGDNSNLQSIEMNAFSGSYSLTSITIPDSVTGIGQYAFNSCYALAEVYNYSTHITKVTIGNSSYYINGALGEYAKVVYNPEELQGSKPESRLQTIGNVQYYVFGDDFIALAPIVPRSSLTSVTLDSETTEIGKGSFSDCYSLTSITIPEGVTSIGSSAFSNCYNLNNVYIGSAYDWLKISFSSGSSNPLSYGGQLYVDGKPLTEITADHFTKGEDTIQTILDYAFYGSDNLTSVTIPDSVTSIGSSAFSNCDNLTSITIPNSVTNIGEDAFVGCDNLNNVYIDSVYDWLKISFADEYSSPLYIGAQLYVDGKPLTEITADDFTRGEDTIQTILDYAFYSCDSLTSVTIPSSVTSIGYAAFESCDNLTSVTIPDSVTSIGNYAFSDCYNLTSITIPNSVTSIGSSAFYRCFALAEVYNYSTHIPKVTIGNSSSSTNGQLGQYAKVVYNPEELQGSKPQSRIQIIGNIQYYVYGDDFIALAPSVPSSSLTSVTLDSKTTEIGERSFSDCYSLTSITIPDSVTSIGSYAFSGSYSLTSITIPDSVTSIGSSAFSGCYSLTSITIPDSVTSIGSSAFYGCHFTSVTYSTSGEGYTFKNGTLTIQGEVPDSPAWYKANINPLVTKVVFEDSSITSIGRDAFSGCSSLTSITIPDSVTSIGSSAFSGCYSLTSITIPDSVTSIGFYAFGGCHFTSVTYSTSGEGYTFKNGTLTIQGEVKGYPAWYEANINPLVTKVVFENSSITSIGSDAFWGCSSLTSITIPDSVTSIGSDAFRYCSSLTSITIPEGVTSIGSDAFESCDSLNTVYIDSQVIMNDFLYSYSSEGLIDKLQSGTGCVYVKDTITVGKNNYLNQGDFQIVPSSVEGYICYRKK